MYTRRSTLRSLTIAGFLATAFMLVALALAARGVPAYAAPDSPASPEALSEALPMGVTTQTLPGLTNLNFPVAMAIDDSGRLFYTEKNTGNVRLYEGGALQTTPVIDLTVDSGGEQGLLGITLDPNYNTNRYIYIFYTCAGCNPLENRIGRFVFDVDTRVAVPNSLQTIYTIPNSSPCQNHNGGNIHFGPDGKLYISTGDDCTPEKSQDLSLKNGKILRINSDGTVPDGGPFESRTDDGKAIWAYGLRNSFDFAFDAVFPERIFASENGPICDDELNRIEKGYNYGWRAILCEDNDPNPQYNTIPPMWYLGEGSPDPAACCLAPTGVEVYSGTQILQWQNNLFMCTLKSTDGGYGTGNLYHFYLDGERKAVTDFRIVSGVKCTMDIETGPDGALYYMERVGAGGGNIAKIVGGAGQVTNTPGPSNTPTRTPTQTATATPTCDCTSTPTGMATNTSQATSTRTATQTQPAASATASATASASATATVATCDVTFQDVPQDDTFYSYITCLACQGIIGGYPCGGPGEPCGSTGDPYYRPGANITRGQISKIVSEAAGFTDEPGEQIYEDVEPGSPFYTWINRLSRRGYMSGYACGGAGEPCEAGNRPYFRPGSYATRGQLTKIVANAAELDQDVTGQTYADVPPSSDPSSFYVYIQRLTDRGVIGGYPCGEPGPNSGPCDSQNRPYFRHGNLVTRGQAAKIVGDTFYPGCERAVDIRNFSYKPETTTVKVGTTVTWTNYDLDYHTVTSEVGDSPLDSPNIQQNQGWSYTFNIPGEYSYYCKPHPYMQARVVVTP